MVNIWAKKTTGLPVRIRSAEEGQARAAVGLVCCPIVPGNPGPTSRIISEYHRSDRVACGRRCAASCTVSVLQKVSHYLLDLDLPTNSPNIISERLEDNTEKCAVRRALRLAHGMHCGMAARCACRTAVLAVLAAP